MTVNQVLKENDYSLDGEDLKVYDKDGVLGILRHDLSLDNICVIYEGKDKDFHRMLKQDAQMLNHYIFKK